MNNSIANAERTYGIEMEMFFPITVTRNDILEKIEEAGVAIKYYSWEQGVVRPTWKMTTDGSLHARCGTWACEIVSPILKGIEGLSQIEKVCSVLNELGAIITTECGLHVHHDAGDFQTKHFNNIKVLYKTVEKGMDAMMPRSRRGSGVRYVGSTLNLSDYDWSYTRYLKLNLCAFQRFGTIEFRHHAGTTDATKIIAWVHITQAMMERSIKGRVTGNPVISFDYLTYTLHLQNRNQKSEEMKVLYTQVRKYMAKRMKHFGTKVA